jgi:hypothetical protein
MSDHTTVAESLAAEHRKNESMRKRSGNVMDGRALVRFLYLLLRDRVQPAELENLLLKIEYTEDTIFSNGWLAAYAQDIADRLEAK